VPHAEQTFCRIALVACVLLTTSLLYASDAALAEALFQEGKQLAVQERWGEACPKFEASYRADRTLGTLLNLADCHEHLGHVATAWAEWNEAIEMAKRSGDDRADYAAGRRDKLTTRLPKLEIAVTRPAAGLDVYRDQVRVEPGAFNAALPVDPGPHEVSVRRGEVVLDRRAVSTQEGSVARVELDLAAIDRAFPAPQSVQSGAASAPQADAPGRGQRTLGFIVGGVGAAALLTAGAFGLVAISSKSKADEPDHCVDKYCGPDGLESADKAQRFAELAQWVGLGGFIVTAAGVTLVLTAPSAPERAARVWRLTPFLSPRGASLTLQGRL